MRKLFVLIGAGVLALVAACGSDPSYSPAVSNSPSVSVSDAAPGKAVNNLPLGKAVNVSGTNTDDKGNDVPYAKTVLVGAHPQFSKDRRYYKYEGVSLEVTYTGISGLSPYNAFDWQLRSSKGDTFNAGSAYGSVAPYLDSGNLRPGRKAHGYITFDVRPGVYTLELQEGFGTVVAPSWTVTVR